MAYEKVACFLPASNCRNGMATARRLAVVLPHFLLSGHMASVVATAVELDSPYAYRACNDEPGVDRLH